MRHLLFINQRMLYDFRLYLYGYEWNGMLMKVFDYYANIVNVPDYVGSNIKNIKTSVTTYY